jgi:hypothetical protein
MQALAIGGESLMPATDATVLDEATPEGKASVAAKKRNALAVAHLTMPFTLDGMIAVVFRALTLEWPGGLAHIIVAALFKKYQPRDRVSRVELRLMLNGISMKKSQDPAVLFVPFTSIENKYNTSEKKIGEEGLIAVAITKDPAEYQSLLTC